MAKLVNSNSSGEGTTSNRIVGDDGIFKKLIENSFSGITLLDKSFKVIYRSPSAERINGWTTINRMKTAVEDVIHPDDEEMVTKVLREVFDNPDIPKTCIFRGKHFSGHFIWLQCAFTNMLHEPDVNAIVCNFIDISSQKHSEALLQQSIDELSAYKYAIDEADIVAITDQKGIIKHVNDNFCKISKYSREELVGQDHRIINSSYHSKAFIRNLWVTIASGKIWKGELKNKAKDGSYYWVDTTIIPFLNKEGKPYQYMAIRSDITERKLFEERIVESERFIKTITDNLPAMIAYWSADLHCLFANEAYLAWFDMPRNEMLGMHKNALMDGFEFEQCKPYIENVLQGSAQSFERSFHKGDDKTIYTHTQYVPDKQGDAIKGFYSLIYDYSEIKDAETELKRRSDQITDLLENITDGFIALDENMCYTHANKHIGVMVGVEPELMIGKNIWELFPNAIGSSTYEAIQTAYAEKRYICNEDYFAPLNLWQENRVYPSGNGVSVFIRDISERKNAEQQKTILAQISLIFSDPLGLNESLLKILEFLAGFGNFNMAEVWIVGHYKKQINQKAKFSLENKMDEFFDESSDIKSFENGEGLPGVTWQTGEKQFWRGVDKNGRFIRSAAAKKVGLKTVLGLPLYSNKEVIGVLVLGLTTDEESDKRFSLLFENFSAHLGDEIKRKQLEEENNQIFSLAPDIICTAGIDGYFKKINPVMSTLLEYTEEELLSRPFLDFVHVEDRNITTTEIKNMVGGAPSWYFENRYITKSGKIKWLAWTATSASEEDLLFCVAKDITEKKELEGLFQKATSLSRIGGWEIDLVAESVYWSAMTREILEVPPDFEPSRGKGLEFYKEGESRVLINQVLTDAIANGIPWDIELQVITAKGNEKWVRVIGEAEFEKNKCIKIIGSFQEIGARKEAELAATEALEERNTILESIGDAFFAVDKNWIITYWNNMAEKFMGKRRDEVLNKNIWEIYPEAYKSEAYKKYQEASETNEVIHFELFSIYLKKWSDISIFPTGNGLSVYVKDINERKKAELAAASTLEEKNTILESIDDAFFAVDKNWTVTYWNNMAEEVLRTPKEAILNHNLWDIFSDSVGSESYKRYHEAVKHNQVAHFEDYFPPLNKWYEISAYPSVNGLSVYFKDVTERKLSEARLKELNEDLQKHAKELATSNAELEQFAYVASHDLQEPLRMVTSFLTQLEKQYSDVVDEKGKKYIHFAVDGAKRMRQIILDLLEFSRVGRSEDDIEEVNINELVNDILMLYRKQIEEQNALIIFDTLPTMQTYAVPIRQVFQNLISNSLKYQYPGKPALINITCENLEACWKFSIKDNGIGIDPEYFDKIFIIFQRLHNKEQYSGTGMGLAITKKIIEGLGGRIWVESEEGKGSTFYFTILKNEL